MQTVAILLLLTLVVVGADSAALAEVAAPATLPTTHPATNPILEAKLRDIDERAGEIRDFSARFEQKKFTALLRKPLVSVGAVRVVGPNVRWDTEKPEPSSLASDGKEMRMYYPRQKLLEIYSIDQRMSDLAGSPLPRLQVLKESFSFQPLETSVMLKDAPDLTPSADYVAAKMLPITPFLKEHVREVRVLLDGKSALMLCVVTVDADGDRTVMRFSEPRLDSGLKPSDLAFNVPPDVKTSHPLETGGGK